MSKTRREVGVIHPNVSIWPANLLRFHIEFHKPVDTTRSRTNIRLISDDGTDATGALVDFEEGFWSPDGRWLTVLFHPGRVKSGLKAREDLGPALIEGNFYELSIRLPECSELLTTTFFAGPVQACELNPHYWRFRRESATNLILEFDHVTDTISAFTHLRLVAADGSFAGFPIEAGPRRIRFQCSPHAAALRVDTRFEDPCGNRIGRPFETTRVNDRWSAEPVVLPIPPAQICR